MSKTALLDVLTAILLRNRKGFATLDSLTRDLSVGRNTAGVSVATATRAGLVIRREIPGHYWFELTDKGREALKRRAA